MLDARKHYFDGRMLHPSVLHYASPIILSAFFKEVVYFCKGLFVDLIGSALMGVGEVSECVQPACFVFKLES